MAINNTNTFTYSTGKTEGESFRKGNWFIGTNDVGKGPTVGLSSLNNFWNGYNTSGDTGFVVYEYKSEKGASIRYPKTSTALIIYTNQIATPSVFTTVEECFEYYIARDWLILLSGDIPAVITGGATLYLEPYNVICNPRNGVWVDLAQKLTFDAVISQLTVTNLGGYQGFAFNGNDYWEYSTDPGLVDMGGDCTLVMWLYSNTNPRNANATLFQKDGNTYSASQQEIEVVWNTNTSINWYSRVGTDVGTIPSLSTFGTGWIMVAIRMSTGKTTAPRQGWYSIDGDPWVSSYTSNTETPLVAAGNVKIGGGDSGTVTQGGLGMVMCYNRMLHNSEIKAVYDASVGLYST